MTGSECKSYVHATELGGQVSVFVLGVDDVHLDATPERAHRKRGQQVRLTCAGMPEHADIRVRVATLVERIDQDWRTCRVVATDEKASGLLQVRFVPRKECHQGSRIEHPLALQTVLAAWPSGDVAVEHAEGAWLQLAENRSSSGLDPSRSSIQPVESWTVQRQIHGYMKGRVLARREATLQILSIR